MDKIKTTCYDVYTRYFNNLTYLGSFNYNEVYKIILLGFIDEIISGKFTSIVPREDYKIIDNLLYKLYGSSCLIPYPEYSTGVALNPKPVGMYQRKYINMISPNIKTTFMRYEDGVYKKVSSNK